MKRLFYAIISIMIWYLTVSFIALDIYWIVECILSDAIIRVFLLLVICIVVVFSQLYYDMRND